MQHYARSITTTPIPNIPVPITIIITIPFLLLIRIISTILIKITNNSIIIIPIPIIPILIPTIIITITIIKASVLGVYKLQAEVTHAITVGYQGEVHLVNTHEFLPYARPWG
ncbi:hypothetical protein Cadr_000013156 [Camelus dromedarius]|uniref:Uncharacterized protein n=1 Tax=Camelus dromedarius TaxID=9838 RepID=A0A5N4DB86_CAMDR|nr:hypothetical protein Cadr_000013156 [Camelus dromedarius]